MRVYRIGLNSTRFALIGDALSSGQIVLVADTRTERETAIAQDVIKDLAGACRDTSMV